VSQGYEGLVLRQGDRWLKVKPKETYDVLVTGIVEGTGKYAGKLGALITDMGKVGTGFTDKDREDLFTLPINTIIEVECMELTPKGKFRHPRFIRVRYDK
jgi:ATP-dependent DNA ligase